MQEEKGEREGHFEGPHLEGPHFEGETQADMEVEEGKEGPDRDGDTDEGNQGKKVLVMLALHSRNPTAWRNTLPFWPCR